MKLFRSFLPNALTIGNLFTGVLGIIYVLNSDHHDVLYFVAIAALFDFLDGFAARALKVTGEFGKQLDSLADVVSFGVLPAVFFYKLMIEYELSQSISFLALLIAAFSALRLAKFNIDTRQNDQFIGLPTPANALLIGSFSFLPFSSISPWLLLVVIAFSCFMLVSPLPMTALKFKSIKWKGNQSRFLLLIGCVILFICLGLKAVIYIIPFYILVSITEHLVTKLLKSNV